jgi:hypothetical protein
VINKCSQFVRISGLIRKILSVSGLTDPSSGIAELYKTIAQIFCHSHYLELWYGHQRLSIETDMCNGNYNDFKLNNYRNLKHYKTLGHYNYRYKGGHQSFQNSLSFPSSPKKSVIIESCVKKLSPRRYVIFSVRLTAKRNRYKNRLRLKQRFVSHKNIVAKF